jgi:hypothetical protein
MLDMATLALMAASPIILGKFTNPFVLKPANAHVVIPRR